MTQPLDLSRVRARFPGLQRLVEGRPAVFFDGPAGSQVPVGVADAVREALLETNANHGGAFATSRESDALLAEAHRAVADLLGSSDSDTIVFGPNMTSLTFQLSRSLARTWRPGDEVLVCSTEHDANFSPWVLAARDAGARIVEVGLRSEDGSLDLDDLDSKLSERTRLLAVGVASNCLGTLQPVAEITRRVHAVGGLVFLDAVHSTPHLLVDVEAIDCDFLVCSAYKFFGPHVGILYGKRQRLEELDPYKLRPPPDTLPDSWMTGTQNHEGIVGTLAAIDYLSDLGREVLGATGPADTEAPERRRLLEEAFRRILLHEREIGTRLLAGLLDLAPVRVRGVTDLARMEERVPTFSFTHERRNPALLAAHLGERGIFTWSGNFYALPVTKALGLEPEGLLRVGLLHYNTAEEVDRLLDELAAL